MGESAPRRLGPYEVVAPLGAGGMGTVYRARDTRLGRDVAVKVLSAGLSFDPDSLEQFAREARAASSLNHPNIITVHDVGTENGASFIAMELVEGQTLADLLAAGPLPLRRLLAVASQIARGLAKAHAAGIVHRDLKPGNLMVRPDGIVKILDFGLAKQVAPLRSGGPSPTSTAGSGGSAAADPLQGTAAYMSPEQVNGQRVDSRSDQFSFGAVLYEMVTGEQAFRRANPLETLLAIRRDEPAPLTAVAPDTPLPLAWVVERCLAKDPEERYAATDDLARDLERLRDHFSDSLSRLTSPLVAVRPPARRRRRLLAGAALFAAGLALGALLGWFLHLRRAAAAPAFRSLTSSGRDSSPAVSPDGRLLAFASERDGQQRIWLKQLPGGTETALTEGPDDLPRFSPDGAMLLFRRREGTGNSLYRVAVLGGEAHRVLDDAFAGDWSPAGRLIAFLGRRAEGETVSCVVGVVPADGGPTRELTSFLDDLLTFPRWSPDGRTIAVTAGLAAARPRRIVLVAADGSGSRVLAPPENLGTLSNVAWLRSGHELLYAQRETAAPGSTARLVRQDLRSDRAEVVGGAPGGVRSLDLLGEGRAVLEVVTGRGSLAELALPPSPGGSDQYRWLTRGTSVDRQPAYAPDGEWVAFSSNRSGNPDI